MNVNQVGGAVLNYLYNNVISHLPVHFIRKGFLRLFNRKIHATAVILLHTRILHFWKVEIGARVVINQYCLLDNRRYKVIIHHDTDIGPYTKIWTSGHDPNSESHALTGGNVVIGHHVWIASGVTVLPNLYVADGTVIGAASVLHKSTNESDVVAGNPVRFIRKRNNGLTYRLCYKPVLE